jgi:hypothetical protein
MQRGRKRLYSHHEHDPRIGRHGTSGSAVAALESTSIPSVAPPRSQLTRSNSPRRIRTLRTGHAPGRLLVLTGGPETNSRRLTNSVTL